MNRKGAGSLCSIILLIAALSGPVKAQAQGTINFQTNYPGFTNGFVLTNLFGLTNWVGLTNAIYVSTTNVFGWTNFVGLTNPILVPVIFTNTVPPFIFLPPFPTTFPGGIFQPPLVAGVAPPANDHFTNAIDLIGDLARATGTNSSATAEAGEPAHEGHPASHSSWWRWTAPQDGFAELVTDPAPLVLVSGSGFLSLLRPAPVWLGVYTGTDVAHLTPIAWAAGSSTNIGEASFDPKTFRFIVSGGQTYFIAADCLAAFGFSLGFETLSLVAPTSRTDLPGNVAVDLEFVPYNTNSGLLSLEVFAGTNSVGVVSNAPFHFLYAPTGGGSVLISAIATNELGQRLFSIPRAFTFRPANDEFAAATVVPGAVTTGSFSAQTEFATAGEGDPEPTLGYLTGHSVWWRWDARYTAETIVKLTSFRSTLRVYEGDSPQDLQEVCFLQTGTVSLPNSDPPSVSFAAEAGRSYYVMAQSESAVSWSFAQRTLQMTPGGFQQRGNVGLPVPLQASWQEANALHPDVEFIVGTWVQSAISGFPYWTRVLVETGRLGQASAPFHFDWVPQRPGLYAVWARGTNEIGAGRDSSETDFVIYTANDDFAHASILPGQTRETNFNFTFWISSRESLEPPHKSQPAEQSVWWKWTPAYSGNVRLKVTTPGLGFPLDVFVGKSLTELRQIAGNDRTANLAGWSGAIRLHVLAGHTYFIRADDTRLAGPVGPGTPLPPWTPPPPITFSLAPVRSLPGELYLSFFKSPLRPVRHVQFQPEPAGRALMPDGHTPVSDSNFVAQLYAGPNPASLKPMGAAQPFIQDPRWAGLVVPAPVVVTNVVALQRVCAQVRVWDLRYGNSYEAAKAQGSDYGESKVLSLIAGSEEIGPAPLTGLSSFTLEKGNVR